MFYESDTGGLAITTMPGVHKMFVKYTVDGVTSETARFDLVV